MTGEQVLSTGCLIDSLVLLQSRGVSIVISSLSTPNPLQVQEQSPIKMSEENVTPILKMVVNPCILKPLAPHGRDHGKWVHIGNVSQVGLGE